MTVVEAGTGSSIFSQPQDIGSVHSAFVNYGNTALDPIYLKSAVKTTVAVKIADNVWEPRARPETGHENNPASVQHAAALPVRAHGTIQVGVGPHIAGPDGHSSRTVRRQARENFSEESLLSGVDQRAHLLLYTSEKQSVGRIRHSIFGQTNVPGSQKLERV